MLLIKNGKIYPVVGEIIENGDILIEDGKIKEIGGNIEVENAEILDATGKNIYPGFVEAHSHLGLDEEGIGFEGQDYNEAIDPVTPHLRSIDSINPMDGTLKSAYEGGVTVANTGQGSANVIGGTFAAIKTFGHRIDDMILKYPTAMKVAFGENPKRVYESQDKSPSTRMATAAILREYLTKAKMYKKGKDLARGFSDMPEFDMKLEALIPVIEREIPLKAHAHRADDIFTALRIAKEFNVDITLDHCTEGHLIVEDLVKEGKPAIVGPSFGHKTKFELKNSSFTTPKILVEAGMKVAITTDSPVIPVENLPLCAAFAVGAGLDEMEALRCITINPAEIIGVADRVGSLEVGKDADLVIMEGNPLRDVNYNVVNTIIDGKIVYTR